MHRLLRVQAGATPNERFHLVVTDFLEEWTEPYRSEIQALVRVVGERWSRRVHEASALFERYGVPYSFYPVDSEEGQALLEEVGKSSERPVKHSDGTELP
jgi:hypothetical protein